MNKLSLHAMKIVRRVKNRFDQWYRHNSFISGLEYYEEPISVHENVNLWCDHVSVGYGAHFYPQVTLWGPGKIVIGKHTEIGIGCTIYSSQMVEIGDNSFSNIPNLKQVFIPNGAEKRMCKIPLGMMINL